MKTGRMFFRIISALLLAAGLCAAAPLPEDEWQALKEQAKRRERRVVYDNDGDDANAFPAKQKPTVANFLALRTAFLREFPVDTVFYTPTSAGFGHLSTATKVGDRLLYAREGGQPVNIAPVFYEMGTDTVAIQLDFARKNRIEFFVSLRMNDTHDAADRPDRPHPLFPRFKRRHPELLLGSYSRRPPHADWSALDYGKKEVRDYFLAIVEELLRDYAVDGIAFDFFRQPFLFSSAAQGGRASDRERAQLTGMFAAVRQLAEKYGRERGRPVMVAVRVPDSVSYCRDLGIDLEAWMRDGLIDIMIGGGNFHLTPWAESVALCRRYGVQFLASVDMPQFREKAGPFLRNAAPSYYARAAAAFQAGADGIFYFNLFSRKAVANYMRPDPEMLKLLPKRYFATDRQLGSPDRPLRGGGRYCELPRLHPAAPVRLAPGETLRFSIEIGDDFAALRAEGVEPMVTGVLRVEDAVPGSLRVRSGGHDWEFEASRGEYHYYRIDPEALRPGVNRLEISSPAAAAGALEMTTILAGNQLLAGDRQPPWRRLWERGDGAEEIVDGAYLLKDGGGGQANLLYPLPDSSGDEFCVSFDCRVLAASDEEAVVLRLAAGGFAEVLSLRPDRVRLLVAGRELAFDAAGDFHTYELLFRKGKVVLSIDGAEKLAAALKPRAATPYGRLDDAQERVAGMDESSLLIGSRSGEGSGAALWRNLRISQPAGVKRLLDLIVEVDFPVAMRRVGAWPYRAQASSLLPTGKHAYSGDLIVAELEFEEGALPEAIVSNGGSFLRFRATDSFVDFPDRELRPLARQGGFLRVELGADGARFFDRDGFRGEVAALENVSAFLKKPEAAERYREEALAVIRQSGIVLSGPAQELRAAVYPRAADFRGDDRTPPPDDGAIDWQFTYEAASGRMPGGVWRGDYQPGRAAVADGFLRLDHTGDGKAAYQLFRLANAGLLEKLASPVVIKSRFRYAGELDEKRSEFFVFGVGVPSGGRTVETLVRCGRNGVKSSFGSTPEGALPDEPVELVIVMDVARELGRMWLDGRLVAAGKIVTAANRQPGIFWGDGSAAAGGVMELSEFKVGTLKVRAE